MRSAAIAVAVGYFAFLGVGIWLLLDGQAQAGETLVIMAMAGGWFGMRWVTRQARERDDG